MNDAVAGGGCIRGLLRGNDRPALTAQTGGSGKPHEALQTGAVFVNGRMKKSLNDGRPAGTAGFPGLGQGNRDGYDAYFHWGSTGRKAAAYPMIRGAAVPLPDSGPAARIPAEARPDGSVPC